jgi:hypothetical protein
VPSGDNTIPVVNDGTVDTEVATWLHRQNADGLAQKFDAQGYTELADVTLAKEGLKRNWNQPLSCLTPTASTR